MYKIAMFFQGIFCDVYLISICYYRGLIITSIVLVQLLEGLGIHEVNVVGLGLVAMLLIAKDAHLHLGTGDVLQPEE